MTIGAGVHLGPYEILAPLGAGGMGEVYRARDSRLAREVALKILPAALSDPERERRFGQEARAAGALNHPNILAVYDVGADDGLHYLVSELIDGEPLRNEMDRGPVPIKRLLTLAAQIADGLATAHGAGIVHRDLKPENVMVTREGRVKIVDFGLAKVLGPVDTGGSPPTTQTEAGLVMGTVPYMSPEQARGGSVDFRSDQFSFGVILYEMAAGVHPFRRETSVQTLSAIIADEARPLTDFCPGVPPLLWWLIDRCLAKEPTERYASTRDLAHDLASLRSRLSALGALDAAARPTTKRRRAIIGMAIGVGLVLVAGTAASIGWWSAPSAPRYRFMPLVTDEGFQGAPAWSPDGKTVAYVSQVDGVLQVFTRNVASSLRGQVTQSRFDCNDPFWSPDGTRIFYHSLAREWESLWSVSAAGGSPDLVIENAAHATISPDGQTLVFFRSPSDQPSNRELWVSSPLTATPQRITRGVFGKQPFFDGAPRFAPDGSKLLVWTYSWMTDSPLGTGTPETAFWVVPWPAGEPSEVPQSPAGAAYTPPMFDWLPDSRHVVVSLGEESAQGTHLWIMDTEGGGRAALTTTPASESRPAVTRDGRRVAFTSEAVDFDVIEIPLDGSAARPIVVTSRNELDPAMAPDRTQYVFVSDRNGPVQIWLRSLQGQWERPLVTADQFGTEQTWALGAPSFSPDGQRIAYQRLGERTGYRIWISTVAAAGPPVQLAAGPFYQDAPSWSPDGTWIAFVQRVKEGRMALARAPVGGGATQILRDNVVGFSRPDWSPDGRWLLCDTEEGLVIVSPDGKDTRVISEDAWIAHGWASNGLRVYGLRESETPRHYMLVSMDIATGDETILKADLGVIPPASQPIRGFSRAGNDGFLTSISRARSDIWVLDGFEPPQGWLRTLWPFSR